MAVGHFIAFVDFPYPLPHNPHSIRRIRAFRWERSLGSAWQPFAIEIPFGVTAKCEVRAVIRFLNAKGVKPIEIHHQLTKVHGESCMDVKNVRKWCREFAAGGTEIHDDKRGGRPSISDETIAMVEQTMRGDRRITLDEISILIPDLSRSTIHRILTENLRYRKVCARWVPRMLTEDHQRQRVDSSRQFLHRYADKKERKAASHFAQTAKILTNTDCW